MFIKLAQFDCRQSRAKEVDEGRKELDPVEKRPR